MQLSGSGGYRKKWVWRQNLEGQVGKGKKVIPHMKSGEKA